MELHNYEIISLVIIILSFLRVLSLTWPRAILFFISIYNHISWISLNLHMLKAKQHKIDDKSLKDLVNNSMDDDLKVYILTQSFFFENKKFIKEMFFNDPKVVYELLEMYTDSEIKVIKCFY